MKVVFSLMLLLLSFPPVLRIFGNNINIGIILYVVITFLYIYNYYNKKIRREIINLIIYLYFISDILFIITLLNGFKGTLSLKYTSYFIVLIIASLWISYTAIRKKLNIYFWFWFAGVLHSIIMALIMFNIEFRDIIYSIVVVGSKATSVVKYNIRTSGIMYSAFSVLSTINSIFFAIGAFYKEKMQIGKFAYIIGQFIITIGIILSGRTGLINLIILFLIYYFIYKKYYIKYLNFIIKKESIKAMVKILIIIVIIIIIALSGNVNYNKYKEIYSRSFEMFINYFEKGELSTTSTDDLLQNEYILPAKLENLLFGLKNSSNYYQSDVGYITIISEVGIVGLILIISSFLRFIIFGIKDSSKETRTFIIFYLIIFFIDNTKDLYIYYLNGFSIPIFCIILFEKLENKQHNHIMA